MACDGWTILKFVQLIFVLACLIFKRVTDDEARSLFLYLQKLSREWSLLNNITWDRIGSSVADATFGGYLIITAALLIGRLVGELPTEKRISEYVFLGVGATLFITIGSLSFASLESVPSNLVDNAAIMGTIALITGILFLIDMFGPKRKKERVYREPPPRLIETTQTTTNIQQVYDVEKGNERNTKDKSIVEETDKETMKNGGYGNKTESSHEAKQAIISTKGFSYIDPPGKGYHQMKNEEFEVPKRFGIYGKDVFDYAESDLGVSDSLPKMDRHSPVWSSIRKGSNSKSRFIGLW